MHLAGNVPHQGLIEMPHPVGTDQLGQRSQLVDVRILFGIERNRAFRGQTHKRSLVVGETNVSSAHTTEQHFGIPAKKLISSRF